MLVEAHRHSVGFYADDAAFVPAVGAFLAAGLAGDDVVLVVATPEHQVVLDEHLARVGLDVGALRASDRYVSIDAQQVLDRFMVDGRPDGLRFEQVLGSVVTSMAGAPRPLRIFGEMVGLLWNAGEVGAAIELEELWNELQHRAPFELHCGYDVDGSGVEADLSALHLVCGAHSELATPAWSAAEVRADDERVAVFLPSAHSLGGVRRFVRSTLSGWALDAVVDDAELAASELATNAVAHAASPFEVTVERSGPGCTLRVRDTSVEEPRPFASAVTVPGGRGLALIAALATAWGVDADAAGKSVWARFETAG